MRVCALAVCSLFALAGVSSAQNTNAKDTNFSVGPQYLLTSAPLFAQPIATPSLSLGAPLPAFPTAITTSAPTQQETFENLLQVEGPTNLPQIYYGGAIASVVEVSFPSSLEMENLPASMIDTGVGEITDVESLRIRGFGITLGEYARYWKAHRAAARRHFTNEDIERLHKAS